VNNIKSKSWSICVTPYNYLKVTRKETKAHHDAINKRDKSLIVSKTYAQGARHYICLKRKLGAMGSIPR